MAQSKEMVIQDDLRIHGCGPVALFALLSFWVIIISVGDIFTNWILEQNIFESATTVPDVRWVVHGVCSLLLFGSLLVVYFLVKTRRLKFTIGIWTIASGVALLLVPIKRLFITNQTETAASQILVLVLFTTVLFIIDNKKKKSDESRSGNSAMFGLAVLIGAGMTIPWLLWGALGSIYDTVLYIVLGLVFALFSINVLYPHFFDRIYGVNRDLKLRDFLLDGFIVALFFLILLTGLAQNGSQILLIIFMPVSAWLIVGIAIIGRKTIDQAKTSAALISGLALVLPLLWFDADELSILTNGTPGETLEWAIRSAWTGFGVILFVVIIMGIYFRILEHARLSKKVNLTLGLLSIAAIAIVYVGFGRPGFYGDKIFVVMKNQTDLTEINQIADVSARRQAVYDTLVKNANDSQAKLRKQLDQWHISYTPYYLVDGLEVDAGPFFSMLIQKRGDVDRILQSPHLRPLPKAVPLTNADPVNAPVEPSWNLKMIHVDQVRQELGVTGKGIVIGQTDTGVDGYHPELKDSYRGATSGDEYNWLDPWNKSPFPTDADGHGTGTLALITGKNIGIAPGAEWIGCVNLARDLGNPAVYLNCMQFMLAPYPQDGNAFADGIPARGAMIVNNSWGCPEVEGCDAKIFQPAVDAMESAGIFMSVAAGNAGDFGCSTVSDPPAIYNDVFTVGSIDSSGNLSSFSSLGPVNVDGSNRVKPDLLAPGEGIVSAFPNKAYTQGDGTSFAAPQVSGVVALMWSANEKLIGNVELTKQILEETATPYLGKLPDCVSASNVPNNGSGFGILNAYAAVKAAMSLK